MSGADAVHDSCLCCKVLSPSSGNSSASGLLDVLGIFTLGLLSETRHDLVDFGFICRAQLLCKLLQYPPRRGNAWHALNTNALTCCRKKSIGRSLTDEEQGQKLTSMPASKAHPNNVFHHHSSTGLSSNRAFSYSTSLLAVDYRVLTAVG